MDTRRYNSRVELEVGNRSLAPTHNMNTSYVRFLHAPVVLAEKPSARGLRLTGVENIKGQNYNIGTSKVGFEGVAEPGGNRREVAKKNELRELTDEEMIITYDELEREMHEIRNNLGKRGKSSDTEAINAWRSRTKDAKEKRTGDIEKRALQLAMAAERIRERTYAGARVIKIGPIRDKRVDRQSAHVERVEAIAQSSKTSKKLGGEARKIKIEENETEPEHEGRMIKSEKKVKTERMETSDDSAKLRNKDRTSSSSKSTGKTRNASSAEDFSSKDDHGKKRGGHRRKSRERNQKNRDASESGGEERKNKHKSDKEVRGGKHKTVKRRRLDFATDESSKEEASRSRKNRKRRAESESEGATGTSISENSDSEDSEKRSSEKARKKEGRHFKKWLTLKKFDGTTPLSIFLNQLDTCARYNGWNEEDKASHLRVSLKGNAAYIIDDENLEEASYNKLIKQLKEPLRYGRPIVIVSFAIKN